MKRVVFMRHGKAEAHSADTDDFERSLTYKGKNVSRMMARKLKEKLKNPGILISSPAFRAIETALIFAREYGINPDTIRLHRDIYFRFGERNFINLLKTLDEDTDTITLFGHNPSFTDLAAYYCRESCDDIPKSGIICLSFNTKIWSDVRPGTGNSELFLSPGMLL